MSEAPSKAHNMTGTTASEARRSDQQTGPTTEEQQQQKQQAREAGESLDKAAGEQARQERMCATVQHRDEPQG